MTRASKACHKLKSLADDDWFAMTTVSKDNSRRFLSEFEQEVGMGRQGPYGALWEQETITIRPVAKEFADITKQLEKNEFPPTERYVFPFPFLSPNTQLCIYFLCIFHFLSDSYNI